MFTHNEFSLIFPLSNFGPLLFCIKKQNSGANGYDTHYGLNGGLKLLSGNIGLNFVMDERYLN